MQYLNKNFYTQLNKIIADHGYIMGPAQTAFLLYGPIEKEKLFSENLQVLKKREVEIEVNYTQHIFPKLNQIVLSLSNQVITNFPQTKKDLETFLQVIPFEEVRIKTGKLYWDNTPFKLDRLTANNFTSDRKIKINKFVRFGFDMKRGFIYAARIKQENSTYEKYKTKFEKLNESDKKRAGDFLLNACELSRNYWDIELQNRFLEEFGQDLNRLLTTDYFGFKIVEFNQNRAEKNLARLARIGPQVKVKGFLGVNSRFDDHRNRKNGDTLKPGGIHFTFIDSGHIDYPLEVQYLDSHSFILDQYGPYAHGRYKPQIE